LQKMETWRRGGAREGGGEHSSSSSFFVQGLLPLVCASVLEELWRRVEGWCKPIKKEFSVGTGAPESERVESYANCCSAPRNLYILVLFFSPPSSPSWRPK
jgi:hypothetical protein